MVLRQKRPLSESAFVELVVWALPQPAKGSTHRFKYRLALVVRGEYVLRYDNEAGKGDHKHVGREQRPYRFVDLDTLQEDFWTDVETSRSQWK